MDQQVIRTIIGMLERGEVQEALQTMRSLTSTLYTVTVRVDMTRTVTFDVWAVDSDDVENRHQAGEFDAIIDGAAPEGATIIGSSLQNIKENTNEKME